MNEYKIPNVKKLLVDNEIHQIKQQFEYEKEIITNKLLNEKDKEIDKLNNIIDELEEHLIAMSKIYEEEYKDIDTSEHYKSMLNKLKELKEKSDKE